MCQTLGKNYLAQTSQYFCNRETEAAEKKSAGEDKSQDSNPDMLNFEAYALCIWEGGPLLYMLWKSHSAERPCLGHLVLCMSWMSYTGTGTEGPCTTQQGC